MQFKTCLRSFAIHQVYINNSLDFSTFFHDDFFASLPTSAAETFNLLDDVHPLHDLAEHDVFPVQPLRLHCADKELGAVGVWTGIGH